MFNLENGYTLDNQIFYICVVGLVKNSFWYATIITLFAVELFLCTVCILHAY